MIDEAAQAMKRLLQRKEWAYRNIFQGDKGDLHEASKIALADLRTFCNGTKSSFSTDALEMARMEGRREVFTRVTNFLNVDYSKYYDLEEEL